MTVLSWLLGLALVFTAVAHVVVLAGVVRRSWWRGALALVIPPLAPYWGFQLGMRRRVAVWWIAVLAYALARTALAG